METSDIIIYELLMNYAYVLGLTFIDIVTGLTAGVIGSGTEIMIVPLLTIFGLVGPMKKRIGTSLVMLLPPIGIMAAYRFYKSGHVDVKAALYMALIFTIFSYLSSKYSVHFDDDLLRQIFAVFTILLGGYLLFTTNHS